MHRMVPSRMGNFGKTELSYLLSEAGVASAHTVYVQITKCKIFYTIILLSEIGLVLVWLMRVHQIATGKLLTLAHVKAYRLDLRPLLAQIVWQGIVSDNKLVAAGFPQISHQ